MPHIPPFSSTVDDAPELALAVCRRAEPPVPDLDPDACEDLDVGQAFALQGAMAPADVFFRLFVKKRQHLPDEPARLRTTEPRRARQVGDEILKFGRLRHGAIVRLDE